MVAIVQLGEVKAHLNTKSDVDDAELYEFIEAATDVVEHYIGDVVDKTYTERHEACENGYALRLFHRPVRSVTSVAPSNGVGITYTTGLAIDSKYAIVRQANGEPFGFGPWNVIYVAGRTYVPHNARLGCLMIIKHMWSTQLGSMSKLTLPSEPGGVTKVPGMAYSIPNRALELLDSVDDTGTGVVVA